MAYSVFVYFLPLLTIIWAYSHIVKASACCILHILHIHTHIPHTRNTTSIPIYTYIYLRIV